MKFFSRAVVFVLFGAMLAAPLAAQRSIATQGNSQERLAGCHEDGGRPPAPSPTGHQCCQSSHDFAIVQQRFIEQPDLRVLSQIVFAQSLEQPAPLCDFLNPAIAPGDPPSALPLRV